MANGASRVDITASATGVGVSKKGDLSVEVSASASGVQTNVVSANTTVDVSATATGARQLKKGEAIVEVSASLSNASISASGSVRIDVSFGQYLAQLYEHVLWNSSEGWAVNLADWSPADWGVYTGSNLAIISDPISGGLLGPQPEVEPEPVPDLDGENVLTYLDEYYYTVYIIERVIEISNPTLNFGYEYYIWNTYFDSLTIDGIEDTDAQGVFNSAQLKDFFKPIGLRRYELEITGDAPASVNATWEFTMSNTETFDLQLITVLANVLTLKPEQPFQQKFTYQTDIMKARDGTEQRVFVYQFPDETSKASFILASNDQIAQLKATFHGSAAREVLIPMWFDGKRPSDDIASNTTTVQIDTSDIDFVEGDYVYIEEIGGTNTDVSIISTINATNIELQNPTSNEYSSRNVLLYPVTRYIRADNQFYNSLPLNAALYPATFKATSRKRIGGKGGDDFVYHKTLPVFELVTSANDFVRHSFEIGYDTFDFGGVLEFKQPRRFSDLYGPRSFHLANRKQRQYAKAFIDYCRGQAKPFFLPTYTQDLILSNQPSVGDSFLLIDAGKASYMTEYQQNPTHKHLAIFTASGETFYREVVTAHVEAGGVERLTLDEPFPADFSSITMVSFLERVRLNSDEVVLDHFSAFSRLSVNVRTTSE